VELRDTNGNVLQDVNSRVYLNANSSFLELEEAYLELRA
jgi:hypothetical protein